MCLFPVFHTNNDNKKAIIFLPEDEQEISDKEEDGAFDVNYQIIFCAFQPESKEIDFHEFQWVSDFKQAFLFSATELGREKEECIWWADADSAAHVTCHYWWKRDSGISEEGGWIL